MKIFAKTSMYQGAEVLTIYAGENQLDANMVFRFGKQKLKTFQKCQESGLFDRFLSGKLPTDEIETVG